MIWLHVFVDYIKDVKDCEGFEIACQAEEKMLCLDSKICLFRMLS
jgi:hypothetical protein